MKAKEPLIGVAFNAYEAIVGKHEEQISETSVQQAAQDVSRAIEQAGYPVISLPMKSGIEEFAQQVGSANVSMLVNLCESYKGVPQKEFNVAAFFEMMDWPFSGNKAFTLALCQQKYLTKTLLQAHGLPCAPGFLAPGMSRPAGMAFPMIVKPNAEDASLGIYGHSVVHDQGALEKQVAEVLHTYHQPALVEAFISGREFNVAVYAAENGPVALPVSEIDFSNLPADVPHILGYEAKWFEDHELYQATMPKCPAPISDELRVRLQSLAIAAFKAVDGRDYARVDFRVSEKEDIYILEVNPNPDISLNAGFARALAAAQIAYVDFWRRMIENTLARKESR